jgi:hypothetical protein
MPLLAGQFANDPELDQVSSDLPTVGSESFSSLEAAPAFFCRSAGNLFSSPLPKGLRPRFATHAPAAS